MSRICDATGKSANNGNLVSHSNNKTKHKQHVNLQVKRIIDPDTGKVYKLKLSSRAIKTLNKVGDVKEFLKLYPHLV